MISNQHFQSSKKAEHEKWIVGSIVNSVLEGQGAISQLEKTLSSIQPSLMTDNASRGCLEVLISVSKKYDNLEWGILLSESNPQTKSDFADFAEKFLTDTNLDHHLSGWIEISSKEKIYLGIRRLAEGMQNQDLDKISETLSNLAETRSISEKSERNLTDVKENLFYREKKFVKTCVSRDFDEFTQIERGTFVILAGRPGMGKSSFASQIIESRSAQGMPTPFFNLEMSAEPLMRRLIAQRSGLNLRDLKNPKQNLTPDQFARAVEAFQALEDEGVKIFDSGFSEVSKVISKIKDLKIYYKTKLGIELDLVVIDYLQLLSGDSSEGRQLEVTRISRALQQCAQHTGVTILCLSQLSRKVEERKEPIPILSDLRESGAIEQDAHQVWFAFRTNMYLPDKSEQSADNQPAFIIKSKDREGITGKYEFSFTPRKGTWIGNNLKTV